MILADLLSGLLTTLEWLAIASVKTIPLIIFVFIIQRVFRKKLSAAAHYLLWFSVMISLIIPFGWNLQMDKVATIMVTIPEQSGNNSLSASEIKTIAAATQATAQPLELLPQSPSAWPDIDINLAKEYYPLTLAIIWLCGAAILTGITLTRASYFHRIRRSADAAPPDFLHLLALCKMELKMNNRVDLLVTQDIQSPITLGWIRPAILLPQHIDQQLAPETLKHVLLHELGHIKRQDIFCNWAACFINIAHWFNPFVWLACRKMRMDMEVACDALVLAHLPPGQHKRYGATLIEISEIPRVSRRVVTTLGILENHRELKERLTMIKEFSTMNLKRTALVGVVLMATAITSLAQPTLESAQQIAPIIATKSPVTIESSTTIKAFAARAEKDLKTKILVGQNYADLKIQVNLGSEPMDYGQVLTQLKINDFTAYKSKDYIQIIPMRDARSVNIPVVTKGKTYFEDEVVTDSIKTEKACVNVVLAVIRPLIPQNGHLTAYEDGRTLVISDTYGNIQRIKNIINSLEDNLDAPEECKNIQPPEERPQNKSNK